MSNINFDNPLLLLVAIPLILLVLIPFAIAVRGENRNIHNVASLVCHILIVIAATLALAGMCYDAMITETNIFVLADVSHSSSNNLDVLDGYVHAVQKNAPKNSKISLIAFGRNYQVLSDFGEDLVSVKNADEVDDSATDIASVMRYAGNLFESDVIKRIVVITDGKETAGNDKLNAVISKLKEENVYIDVIYLDNNIDEDVKEIQLTDVQYTANSFVGKEEKAQLKILSNNADATRVYIDVVCNGESSRYAHTLYKGENLINVPLNTEKEGTYEYTITVTPEIAEMDTSYYNNCCLLKQTLSDAVNVIFIGGSDADCDAGKNIYGVKNVEFVSTPSQVPYTVEELCTYDEIVLCNFDVRTLANSEKFVSSLNTVVSKFGKTLTTFGNTYVQEVEVDDDTALKNLGGMLPVNMGNPNRDARLVTILLDISTSTNFSSRLEVMRNAVEKLITTMDENDSVMVIGYSGDNVYLQTLTKVRNKEKILNAIYDYEPRNGTYLKGGLEFAYDEIMKNSYHRRELIVISDGVDIERDAADCIELAEKFSSQRIIVSALGVYQGESTGDPVLKRMVMNEVAGRNEIVGYYKEIEGQDDIDYVMDEIVEQMQESKVEGDQYELVLKRPQDAVLTGVYKLHSIGGFWYNTAKSGVEPTITATYWRDKTYSIDVPVYATWKYGNGSVSSFTSDITGQWTKEWGEQEKQFLTNINATMVPDERIESPFLISTEVNGGKTTVSVTTDTYRNDAILTVTMKAPDGSVLTKPMYFSKDQYFCEFETNLVGRYEILFEYDYSMLHYQVDHSFAISYYPEYDAFATYNVASLYRLISENGEVSTDGELRMDNSDSATRSYTFSFVVPLMVFCVVVFVVDICIRIIRWKDIRSLFLHERKRLGKN